MITDKAAKWLMDCFGEEIRAIHEIESPGQEFENLMSKKMHALVRRSDLDYQTGDWLLLREREPVTGFYSGRQLFREITHIIDGGQGGLPADLCVLSIR